MVHLEQWTDPPPGIHVLGIEPANRSKAGRRHDLLLRMPMIALGEVRSAWLTIEAAPK